MAALGERATEAVCNDFNRRYGLDQPIPVQFATYLGQLATGDLGDSLRQGRPVSEILIERLPVTLELTLFALAFATIVGVTLGRLSATRRNSPIDVGTMLLANLGVSIPVFVLGLLLAYPLRGRPARHAVRAAAVRPALGRHRLRAARRAVGHERGRPDSRAPSSTSCPG